MRILDEKGRIFGSINIVDLGVILLLILLVGGGIKRMSKKPRDKDSLRPATITMEVEDVRVNTVEALLIGAALYIRGEDREFGRIEAKRVEPYREPVRGEDMRTLMLEVPERYRVTLTLKSHVEERTNVMLVGGEATRVNSEFKFENRDVEFTGRILTMKVD